ncbi:MAG: hypothetical protein PUD92_05110, partial [Clostridiales bacterium]|nr:hypothetical protein [Clostridiales bacterium]
MKLFKRFLAGAVSAAILASSAVIVMAADDNITVRNVMKTDDTTLTVYLSDDCNFDISGYTFSVKEGEAVVLDNLSGTKVSERRITVDVGASIEDDKDYTLEWYKDEYDEGSSFAFKTYYSFTNDATTVTSAGNIGWTCDAEGNYFLRPMKADGSQLADVTTTSNKVNDGAVISADFDSFGDKSCVISYDFTIQDSRIAFGFLAICNAYRDKLTNNYIKDG